MTTITEDELHPGGECPECGETMVTWFAEQVSDTDDIPEDMCWFDVDDVEKTSFGSFGGNIIVIDHTGPSMDV